MRIWLSSFALVWSAGVAAITITRAAPVGCDVTLLEPAERVAKELWVRVDGIVVTGAAEHPTADIVRDLKISPEDRAAWRGRAIVSLGEGMSGLVPFLHALGLSAVGIDLWYDAIDLLPDNRDGLRMKAHVERHRALLRTGDVRHLDWADASVDVVLSHQLLNNIPAHDFAKAHHEILRIMKPGAEARLFAPVDDVARNFYEAFRHDVRDFALVGKFVVFRK